MFIFSITLKLKSEFLFSNTDTLKMMQCCIYCIKKLNTECYRYKRLLYLNITSSRTNAYI